MVFRDWRVELAAMDCACDPKHALGRHRGLSTGKLECQLLPLVGTIMIAGQRERQPKRCARHQSDRPPRSRPVQQNEIS
jgi:hypothetical protein